MKKIIAIIITLAMSACLTACKENPSYSSENSKLNPLGSQTISHTDSFNETSNSNSKTSVDAETLALINSFAIDSFIAPDGSTVNKSEAVYAVPSNDGGSVYAIGFDFSYMRYAKPLFESTFDKPDLIDWDTLEFNTDIGFMVEDPNYFKVRAGDTLENGLTVESAQYWIDSAGNMFSSEIVFDGELTLDGILYCIAEIPDYIDNQGDLIFFADPTKSDFVPMPKILVDFTEKWLDTMDNFAAIYDGKRIRFGNINNVSVDLSDTFRDSSYVKARITMKGVRAIYTENGGGFVYAEPVFVKVVG